MSSEHFNDLLQTAYQNIENDDLVAAMEVTKKILNENSEHPYGLEVMGYLLLELNCLEEAKFCFSKSIENGNENHTPYLYLGQLTSSEESVNYFLKAVDMMKEYLKTADDKIRLFKPAVLDVSNCYVSLSEIYMTDLCDDEDAETKCRNYINNAIEADVKNPAAWQALASLNLVKNDIENCKINIKKSLDLWLPEAKEIMAKAESDEEDVGVTCELSLELRTKCAEILFEIGMFDEMKSVLESVLVEDEEHMQAHYMMATMLKAQIDAAGEGSSEEMIETLLMHTDMALNLADPELEGDAVEKMQSIIEKYGGEEEEGSESSCSSGSDDDDVME